MSSVIKSIDDLETIPTYRDSEIWHQWISENNPNIYKYFMAEMKHISQYKKKVNKKAKVDKEIETTTKLTLESINDSIAALDKLMIN